MPVTKAAAAAEGDHYAEHGGDHVCVSLVGSAIAQEFIEVIDFIEIGETSTIVLRWRLTHTSKDSKRVESEHADRYYGAKVEALSHAE